jgi:8-oxo-dGTP diphosphatase
MENKELIKNAPIYCSIDPIIFSIVDDELNILLYKREKEPYKDSFALPGGLVQPGEDNTLEDSVSRVLEMRTGVKIQYVEQVCSVGGWRDVRGWTLSVAYMGLVNQQEIKSRAQWIPVSKLGEYHLAFDHITLIEKALQRLTDKVNYSTLPLYFMPEKFTLPQLKRVYEIILGDKSENKKSKFYDKMKELDMIEALDEYVTDVPYRPPQLHKLKDKNLVTFRKNVF